VEDLAKDYGEDLLVRIFDEGKTTPWSFFVQSKATDKLEALLTHGGKVISYPIDSDHLEHWARFWEPIVLTVYDTTTATTYWEIIQNVLDVPHDGLGERVRTSVVVHVPTDNVLDQQGFRRLRQRTKRRFERFEAQKEGAEVLIEELKRYWGVTIEYAPDEGVLFLPKGRFTHDESGERMFVPFGRTAASLLKMQRRHGLSPTSVFEQSLELLAKILATYRSGGKLQLQDQSGAVVREWNSFDELQRHVERDLELEDE
jgi:hypothetical protein